MVWMPNLEPYLNLKSAEFCLSPSKALCMIAGPGDAAVKARDSSGLASPTQQAFKKAHTTVDSKTLEHECRRFYAGLPTFSG